MLVVLTPGDAPTPPMVDGTPNAARDPSASAPSCGRGNEEVPAAINRAAPTTVMARSFREEAHGRGSGGAGGFMETPRAREGSAARGDYRAGRGISR